MSARLSIIEALPASAEAAAKDRADWLLDAIATATQNRTFLRGDPEYDWTVGAAILMNGEKAIMAALGKALRPFEWTTGRTLRGWDYFAAPYVIRGNSGGRNPHVVECGYSPIGQYTDLADAKDAAWKHHLARVFK